MVLFNMKKGHFNDSLFTNVETEAQSSKVTALCFSAGQ